MGTLTAEVALQGEVAIVRLNGSVDAATSPEMEKHLRGAIRDGKKKIIVGMKDVAFMSSAGWGLLLSIIKEVRATGGSIAVAAMTPEIRHVYSLLGMKAFVKEFPSEADATAALR